MKHWILAAATLLLIQGVDAREHWGPPPLCPQPKVDCCPKPKCPPPKPCPPKECKPKACPTEECCPKPDPCKPCCPPVCFERGLPTKPCCTPSAYSEPAAIQLDCGWNTFVTANFIYWEAVQDGMDLAVPGQGTIVPPLSAAAQSAVGESILFQDTDYKPGFQVGLGWSSSTCLDNWVLYAQYTWLHGSTSTDSTAPNPDVDTINGVALPQNGLWIPSSWFSGQFQNNITTEISSEWDYKIDIVDAQISRPFYSGARFTVNPFFGLRGAWIRQSLDLSATSVAGGNVAVSDALHEADYNSRAMSVGPRIGMNGNWHLGYGVRFEGNAAASLLFTAFDVHQNQSSPDAAGNFRFPLKTKIDDLNVLRPNLDLSLGLGWGSYFGCRRFYVDLAATYDFSVFWQQNMMRYLADLTENLTAHPGAAAGDLFLHGLTVKTRFDF